MAYVKWRRGDEEIARRIGRDNIKKGDMAIALAEVGSPEDQAIKAGTPDSVVVAPDGVHRRIIRGIKNAAGTPSDRHKGVQVDENCHALFFINGELVGRLRPGAHRFDRVPEELKGKTQVWSPEVLLVDAGEIWIDTKVREVSTADPLKVDITAQIAIEIEDPAQLLRNVLKSRDAYTIDDIKRELFRPVIAAIEAFAETRTAASLTAPDATLRTDLVGAIVANCGDFLARCGLSIAGVNAFETRSEIGKQNLASQQWRNEALAELRELRENDRVKALVEAYNAEQAQIAKEKKEAEEAEQREEDRLRKAAEKAAGRQEAAEALEDEEVDAEIRTTRDRQALAEKRRQIDVWAAFAAETLRETQLQRSHKLELQDRLEGLADSFKKKGVLREEDWKQFQQDIGWKKLQRDWEDASRGWKSKEHAKQLELKSEHHRRLRVQALELLDLRLAEEVALAQMNQKADIQTLASELSERRVNEMLSLDQVEEEAKQGLAKLVFEGTQDEDQRAHQATITGQKRSQELELDRWTFADTVARMKANAKADMGKEELRVEAELTRLATQVLEAALDKQMARNLVQEAEAEGNKALVEIDLSIDKLKDEAGLDQAERAHQQKQRWADEEAARRKAQAEDAIGIRRMEIDLEHKRKMLELEEKEAKANLGHEQLAKTLELEGKLDDGKWAREQKERREKFEQRLKEQQQIHDHRMDELSRRQQTELTAIEADKEIKLAALNAQVNAARIGAEAQVAISEAENNAEHEKKLRGAVEGHAVKTEGLLREQLSQAEKHADDWKNNADKRGEETREGVRLGADIANQAAGQAHAAEKQSRDTLADGLTEQNRQAMGLANNTVQANASARGVNVTQTNHPPAAASAAPPPCTCVHCNTVHHQLERRCSGCGRRLP